MAGLSGSGNIRILKFGDPLCSQLIALRKLVLQRFIVGTNEYEVQDLDQEQGQTPVIYEESGIVLGCLMLKPSEDGAAFKLRQMAVRPKQRGKQIGMKLVQFAEQFVMARGVHRIHLDSRVSAVGFYIKLGYQTVGDEYIEYGICYVKMQKELVALVTPE